MYTNIVYLLGTANLKLVDGNLYIYDETSWNNDTNPNVKDEKTSKVTNYIEKNGPSSGYGGRVVINLGNYEELKNNYNTYYKYAMQNHIKALKESKKRKKS
jgi:hypothetical protein